MATNQENNTTNPGNGIINPDTGKEYVTGTNMDIAGNNKNPGSGFDDTVSPINKGIDIGGGELAPDVVTNRTPVLDPAKGGQADPLLDPKYVRQPKQETGYKANLRQVKQNELASTHLTSLLAGNSQYMRQAKQEGLELGGGLGGTQGIRSSYSAAIKAGGPLAIADAQAYRDAAAQNQTALNDFGLANIQRQTQLELGVMDSNTRLQVADMNNTTQMSIAKMNDLTQRDISQLDADTRMAVTRLDGEIRGRLADNAFKHSQILNSELAGYESKQIDQRGEIDYAQQERRIQATKEANYIQNWLTSYDQTMTRIDNLNGIEMDDAARARAQTAIWEEFDGMSKLIESLYPGVEPIKFG
jgi:hypothetical protein